MTTDDTNLPPGPDPVRKMFEAQEAKRRADDLQTLALLPSVPDHVLQALAAMDEKRHAENRQALASIGLEDLADLHAKLAQASTLRIPRPFDGDAFQLEAFRYRSSVLSERRAWTRIAQVIDAARHVLLQRQCPF